MANSIQPRAFVSSVMDDFADYRQAARAGITTAGGEPVLVEDYPTLIVSPRTACLDAVASCDFFVLIIGERGGWTTPSGKLVVEEELEEAERKKLHILPFIQQGTHDADAQRLISRVSDYVDGKFRRTFDTADDLREEIEDSLRRLIGETTMAENLSKIVQILQEPFESRVSNGRTRLRFAIVPERVDDFIDVIDLDSESVNRQLLELGHSADVNLFSYKFPHKTDVEINEIIVSEVDQESRRASEANIRLKIFTNGMIVIDSNVASGTETGRHDPSSDFVILERDVVEQLRKCFSFSGKLFDIRDKYKRFNRLFYNAVLYNVGNRNLVSEIPQNQSFSMRMQGENAVRAFDEPRALTRADLVNPLSQIDATMIMFKRRFKKTTAI